MAWSEYDGADLKAKARLIYKLFSGLDEYASDRDQKRMERAIAMAEKQFGAKTKKSK